ncbi:3-deoxy-manno-octulosonate cytidylyltransferase [uncultured Cohaesibacter sp.]|uniref:3-deoxy-manno-octulosonate cytidylyltransferase n=1 Tax=uncultured Cohaesibacter sp. TaxID=1002546 RepID=UPI0029300602|nr:3-deoxy-manno-octulosonate cytidylyltransferase [uncultured Cohaesibacter sp.]
MSTSKNRTNPIILIPARMASVRLPGKPLLDIAGEPMIVQVWRRAIEADIAPVVVATDGEEIAGAIRDAGGNAVVTNPDHPSGSDRIFEAVEKFDPDKHFDIVINVQGDLPTINPTTIRSCLEPFSNPEVDITTLTVEITDEVEKTNPNVVKIVGTPTGYGHMRALYFTRATAPYGDGPLYHHIGLYAYRRRALEKYVSLPVSTLEKREKLEQLRALEAGMRIEVVQVDDIPLGVDTRHDLEKARTMLDGKS